MVANVYAFEGEYMFSEPLFYTHCQRCRRRGTIEQIGWYPLGIVVADKCIRTGSWHPASAIELQRGDPTVEAEERIPHRRGVAEPTE